MWSQDYTPVAHSLPVSALVASLPVVTLLFLLGVKRQPAWRAALFGLTVAVIIAAAAYRMPLATLGAALLYGAAFGLWPIGWIVFTAVLLYRVTLESGRFDLLKDSIARLTTDRRLQVLLIAFCFGAFLEGAAGFGTPVAIAAAMLVGLGFPPLYAAGMCLLANTAPVAFGSIAIPITTLAITTGLPVDRLSAAVGRICAPVSLIIPAYLILVMSGWRGLRTVIPAVVVCGGTFAGAQFAVSNYLNPQLTDILSSLTALGALVLLCRFWQPVDAATATPAPALLLRPTAAAWMPYGLLVAFVLLWGYRPLQALLKQTDVVFAWPDLHESVQRVPPIAARPTALAATYTWNWLSSSGTACLLAVALGAAFAGLNGPRLVQTVTRTARDLVVAELTLAAVLALAFVMNYSGATGTLGLAFARTGGLFPFFSAMLGWLGVFLTGSDTSANALFGTLQTVTAGQLGIDPVLMAASNSSGGVMGKMISLTSIAVAAAATGMKRADESALFRFTFKHSVLLAALIGLVVMFYVYVAPSWIP